MSHELSDVRHGRSRLLLTGGTGLLGKSLIEMAPPQYDIWATHLRPDRPRADSCHLLALDITDRQQILQVIKDAQPTVVIHTAGVGSVDYVEKNQEEARAVNIAGTEALLEACRDCGARLIYLSSNAVYDGDAPPYDERSERKPINYYGKLKVESEDAVMASGLDYSIVRPILMYGWHHPTGRPNPVTLWLRSLRDRQAIRAVDDRFWQPLFVQDCALVIWRILERDAAGVYNVSGPDRVSMLDFARQTARVFDLDETLIEPVSSDFFPSIAPRPVDTSFTASKIHEVLDVWPAGITGGLERMKGQRESERGPNQ